MTKTLLKDTHPQLEVEWDAEKNTKLKLSWDTMTSSNPSKAWWKDDLGHEWFTAVATRTEGSGCPFCSNKKVLAGFNDLATVRPELAAEWHPTKNDKTASDVLPGAAYNAWWQDSLGHEWQAKVYARNNTANPKCPYCAGQRVLAGFNDLASQFPKVVAEWHPTKNDRDPSEVHMSATSKKYWWKCTKKGHEWQTTPAMRTQKHSGCPECSGRGGDMVSGKTKSKVKTTESATVKPAPKSRNAPRVKSGVNDLATKKPDVAKFYNEKKNPLPVNGIALHSADTVWWICEKGHEWERNVTQQSRRPYCPYCTDQRLITGVNDFATKYPELAKQWVYTRDGSKPSTTLYTSSVRVTWQCDKGHEWDAKASQRATYNTRCPFCSNRRLAVGENDLVSQFPELAKQYDKSKNSKPLDKITIAYTKPVWWKCENGHEWENTPQRRTYNARKLENFTGNGCPECVPPKVSKDELEVLDYIKSLGFEDAISSDRTILGGKELDIYLPEQKFAVEYNGLYWHAESQGRGQDYHLNKWKACNSKGVQLIQVWEDDWRDNKALVKTVLADRLGKNTVDPVDVNETIVKEFLHNDVKAFMKSNSLRGGTVGDRYYGLVSRHGLGVLVALLVVNVAGSTSARVVDFVTSRVIPGGFNKLLGHLFKEFPGVMSVTADSDNSYSDGKVFSDAGFVVTDVVNDCSYLTGNIPVRREDRANYTLEKYESRPDLAFEPGLSEEELMYLNGLDRVWAAGTTQWTLKRR